MGFPFFLGGQRHPGAPSPRMAQAHTRVYPALPGLGTFACMLMRLPTLVCVCPQAPQELPFACGDVVEVIHDGDGSKMWWLVRDQSGASGFVPSNYLAEPGSDDATAAAAAAEEGPQTPIARARSPINQSQSLKAPAKVCPIGASGLWPGAMCVCVCVWCVCARVCVHFARHAALPLPLCSSS